jgi:DNA-binding beta-propeller fold protein YncE
MLRDRPNRIALGSDVTKLYVTYGGQSTFDIVDLTTKSIVRTVDVSSVMTDGSVTDIYVTTNGQLFVSGRKIVKVDPVDSYSLQVVANNVSFFGDRPRFLADDGAYLYLEVSSHTPNSLFKLDISRSDAPVILEDEHGSVSGTANAVLSPDGTRLYMNNGKLVLTSDFTTVGEPPEKTFAVAQSPEEEKVYTSTRWLYAVGAINVLDATSFANEKQWEVGFLASRIFAHNSALYIFGVCRRCRLVGSGRGKTLFGEAVGAIKGHDRRKRSGDCSVRCYAAARNVPLPERA